MIHVILPLLIGTLTGLLSALLTKAFDGISTLVDATAGIAGAVPLAWFVQPLGDAQPLNRPELIGAFCGAVFLVAVARLVAPLRKSKR